MIPIAGSAYTYAYATLGEIIAWMIGWDLILEYAVGSMTVAIGWSGYFQRILAGFGHHAARLDVAPRPARCRAPSSTCPAIVIVLAHHGPARHRHPRERALQRGHGRDQAGRGPLLHRRRLPRSSSPRTGRPSRPTAGPASWPAGAVVFFAYIGFDAVSTTAEEAKNPKRDLPIGIIASLVICTVLYIVGGRHPLRHRAGDRTTARVEAALPGTPIVPLEQSTAFLNAPVAYALHVIDQDWAAGLISAGAVAGITSVLLVMLMSQPRIFFSMSRDRLLPGGREQGPPALRHALHHHDHHRASSSPSWPGSPRSTSSAR